MGKTAIKIQTFGKMYLLDDFMWFCDNFVSFLRIIVYVEKNYMPGGIAAKGNYDLLSLCIWSVGSILFYEEILHRTARAEHRWKQAEVREDERVCIYSIRPRPHSMEAASQKNKGEKR